MKNKEQRTWIWKTIIKLKRQLISFCLPLSVFRSPIIGLIVASTSVYADAPEEWRLNFQEASTSVMQQVRDLHDLIMIILFLIALLVLVLLGIIIYKFRAAKNPTPSSRAHHTFLEIAWTALPVVILLIIALPSFKLMFYMSKATNPEMTIKVTGNTWYWNYDYPEHQVKFDSNMIPDKELKPGQLRLLDVNHQMVVPVGTTIRLLFTSNDVIHSWAVPSFGVKKDCIPGRLNESWIRVEREGTYYGQCSELCGIGHGFMPIAVKAVSKKDFNAWIKESKARFG